MREGSLFSGYNGLGMAVSEVFGSEPAWFSEIEDGPSKILAHHWAEVPNHGDITEIDWDQVEPVDILSGGFPCQDVSAAGKRAGMHPDNRSGLWNHFAYARRESQRPVEGPRQRRRPTTGDCSAVPHARIRSLGGACVIDPMANPGRRLFEQARALRRAKRQYLLRRGVTVVPREPGVVLHFPNKKAA